MKLYNNTADITIQTFDDSEVKRPNLAQIFPYNVTGSKERIKELQAKGAGIYFACNPQIDGLHRSIEYTKTFKYLSLDLDVAKEGNHLAKEEIEAAKQKLLDNLKTLLIPPYGVIFTKNGLQPVWRFSNSRDLKSKEDRFRANAQYQAMVKGVTKVLGYKSEGDNLCRVIRFPSSNHLKAPTDPYKITYQEISGKDCTFEDFNKVYPPINSNSDSFSSNKFDWSRATGIVEGDGRNDKLLRAVRSALARGIPEEITLDIARGLNQTFERPLEPDEFKEVFENAKDYADEENSKIDSKENKISWPSFLDEAAFYGIAGEYAKIIEPHTESDPVAILINFLVAFGSIIGSKPYFQVEAAKHRMRLFTVLVGDTSKARKGTSWNYIRNIFETIDKDWKRNIQTGLSSGEGLIWAIRDEIIKRQPAKERGQITGYQDVIEDEGVKDKRLLVIESEFASTLRVIGREGNTLSPIIRNAWDIGDLQTLTKNSPAKATNAHISIIGHITQDELLRYLTSTEIGNGFGNRFLFACVRRSKELPHGGNIQSVNFSSLVNRLREAVEFAKNVDQVKWDEETYNLWTKIYHNLSEAKPGLVGALTARAEAYVCRIACIYALLDKSNLIKVEHLKAAIAIWDYAEASVKYIFQGEAGDPIANKIIETLANHPGRLARTDISNLFGRNVNSYQLSLSLDSLLNLGRIKSESIQTDGRSKELFSLNSFNSYTFPDSSYLEILEGYISSNGNESGGNTGTNNLPEGYEKNEINELSIQSPGVATEPAEKEGKKYDWL